MERGERGERKEVKGRRRKEGGERKKGGGKKGGGKKGGGSGCCNTATYSTGEGGAAMERERGEIIIQIIMLL